MKKSIIRYLIGAIVILVALVAILLIDKKNNQELKFQSYVREDIANTTHMLTFQFEYTRYTIIQYMERDDKSKMSELDLLPLLLSYDMRYQNGGFALLKMGNSGFFTSEQLEHDLVLLPYLLSDVVSYLLRNTNQNENELQIIVDNLSAITLAISDIELILKKQVVLDEEELSRKINESKKQLYEIINPF